jgi:serine/threonine protein kinase
MGKIYGDRWETLDDLPEGGQAYVYLVKDTKGKGDTKYVLKRLKNPKRIDRFTKEIEAVRSLSHPNILQLIDFDLTAAKPYLVTEYCSGGSLAKAEPFWNNLPLKALELFQQICEGVAYAHSNNIIHRDLKPDNIFLRSEDGPAVIGDFGICYLEEDGTRITLTDEAVGSLNYMAPELEDGRTNDISFKSDIYSLGKILYWLLSGGKIFRREKHREQGWDLMGWDEKKSQWNNIYMEHINRLLDCMIVNNPNERRLIEQVLPMLQDVMRLMRKEFNPISISKDIPLPCLFCGQGQYKLLKTDKNISFSISDIPNFPFNQVRNVNARIMVCDTCGHVQVFRIDQARKRDWWGVNS